MRAPSDLNLWDNCQNPGLSTFNEKKLEGFRGSYICYLLLFLHVSALLKNRRGSPKILDSGQNSHKIIIISLNFCPQGGLTWKEGNSTVFTYFHQMQHHDLLITVIWEMFQHRTVSVPSVFHSATSHKWTPSDLSSRRFNSKILPVLNFS